MATLTLFQPSVHSKRLSSFTLSQRRWQSTGGNNGSIRKRMTDWHQSSCLGLEVKWITSPKPSISNLKSEWRKAEWTVWVGITNVGATVMRRCLIGGVSSDLEIWSDLKQKLFGLFSVLNLAGVYVTVPLYSLRGFHLFQWAVGTRGLANL